MLAESASHPRSAITSGAQPPNPGQGASPLDPRVVAFAGGLAGSRWSSWVSASCPVLDPRQGGKPALVAQLGRGCRALERQGRGCNRRTSEDHSRVRGVQAPELHHQEEPSERPRPPGDQEVLPELQDPPRAQGNPLTPAFPASSRRGRPRVGAASSRNLPPWHWTNRSSDVRTPLHPRTR